MKFRPCIDIHNGKVKQIVGASLADQKDHADENFVSEFDSKYFADLYKKDGLTGGHIILLNAKNSRYYKETLEQAVSALHEYPDGLQIGGGITEENALFYLENGASHVIVTSYVFANGIINYDHLEKICNLVGKERLVLDLSCRMKNDQYYIVTDRWQNFTDEILNHNLLTKLSCYCAEYLIHAVDVEGKVSGIEEKLVKLLGGWDGIPITYAGGISSLQDIDKLEFFSNQKLDYTIGSALDIFGGKLPYHEVKQYNR